MNLETRKPEKERGNESLINRVIGAAIQVHTELGPGFLESLYEEALGIELRMLGIQFERQKPVPLFYRGQPIGEHRVDLLIDRAVVVELKATSVLENIHFAILRSYLKALGLSDGVLFNFASTRLTIKRVGREFHSRPIEEDISF
ncbi:MAG: GxxExxY protein [Chthoniobacterales bacterium]|nr:GxxExxY protein [Chthoniobacterales bacterium]